MNLELGRNARSCRDIANSSDRGRNFWMPSMSANCSPSRSAVLSSERRDTGPTYNPISRKEQRKQEMADSMRTVLNGVGGGRELLKSLDQSTLHVLMALKESGQNDLVKEALAAAKGGLEWRISIRKAEG